EVSSAVFFTLPSSYSSYRTPSPAHSPPAQLAFVISTTTCSTPSTHLPLGVNTLKDELGYLLIGCYRSKAVHITRTGYRNLAKPMEDQEDEISSPGFGPLFIIEETGDTDRTIVEPSNGNQNPTGHSFTEKQLKQSAISKPYQQEMDVLLKSCEKLTGIPFRSRHIEGYSKASLSKPSCIRGKEEVRPETYGEACSPPQADRSSCYIDTQMDGTQTENELAEGQSLCTVIHRPGTSYCSEMPLSSAGNSLSDSMLEYEGQLLGMLAMLESCMEETGMDFEAQNQAADVGQEYVHIRKNLHHHRGTTLTLEQQDSPALLPVYTDSCVKGDKASKDDGIGETIDSARKKSPQNNLAGCSKERTEMQGYVKVDQDPDFMFLEPQGSLDQANIDPMYCEGINTEHMFNEETETMEDIAGIGIVDASFTTEDRHKLKTDLETDMNKLRSQMEDCIEEVQRLEKKRKELLMEVLQLRGPGDKVEVARESKVEEDTEESIDSKAVELIAILKLEEDGRREERKKEIHSLREERAEEERKTWKVSLERQRLQEEHRRLRRRLFAVARECAHSQATLNNQRCDLELLRAEEEKLNSLVLQLAEESSQLRSAQQEQLLELQAKLHHQSSGQTSNTQEELTDCRRNSCGDVEQYVQGGLKALEDRYEPVLVSLLKRKEATAGGVVKAKQQSQELRVQLKPLREEIQKLQLERTCLEERLKLTFMQRQEDASHYKEAVHFLEESIRELRTELEIQKRKTKEMEELRESLTKQLLLYRIASEDHSNCDQQGKT
ncbi:hypothetical protein ATANTOWER_006748, partial [Ataeniobius toweri]|nr:hypothetical protein [Ataeniobius toweri]